MDKNLDIFLRRLFLYRMQYVIAGVASMAIWYCMFVFCCFLDYKFKLKGVFEHGAILIAYFPIIIFSLFNTITYFYSKYFAKRYGIEMFADLDQDWLREHQAFDSKAFGEIFVRLIQCRKIAGPYMFVVIALLAFINMYLAGGVGVFYFIGYIIYRMTYFDDALSYKVPRAMGGGGIVVSKIIDEDFNAKLDKLSEKLEKK